MSKLNVLENKKLVLNNVLKKEIRNISLENINKEIQKFTNKLQLLNVQVFGPLIIKSCGTNIHENGTITADYDLMVQSHDFMQYKNEFVILPRFECSHCAFVHFEGEPSDVSYATAKLDLFFYENDLEGTGENYTVCIMESEDHTVMDFFRPVKSL